MKYKKKTENKMKQQRLRTLHGSGIKKSTKIVVFNKTVSSLLAEWSPISNDRKKLLIKHCLAY